MVPVLRFVKKGASVTVSVNQPIQPHDDKPRS